MSEQRLIDANALMETWNLGNATKYGNITAEDQAFSYDTMFMYEIADMIEDAPTIDPVRHGEWIKTFRYMGKNLNTGEVIPVNSYDCSECGYHTGNQGRKFNYCPNCGAKMDKE